MSIMCGKWLPMFSKLISTPCLCLLYMSANNSALDCWKDFEESRVLRTSSLLSCWRTNAEQSNNRAAYTCFTTSTFELDKVFMSEMH